MGTGRGQGRDQRALSEVAEQGSGWGAAAAVGAGVGVRGQRTALELAGAERGRGALGGAGGRAHGTRPCAT